MCRAVQFNHVSSVQSSLVSIHLFVPTATGDSDTDSKTETGRGHAPLPPGPLPFEFVLGSIYSKFGGNGLRIEPSDEDWYAPCQS